MKLCLYFAITTTFLYLVNGSEYKNVYGDSLSSCSSDGMALTGYTRTGNCVDQNDDTGSHHICIDMTSTTGGDFCEVTGQSDWCSSKMPCQENLNDYCQIQHWCVCQWAFASYIENAGGCDAIQDVVCDAINMQAIVAYQQQSSSQKHRNALNCLVQRCSIRSTNNLEAAKDYLQSKTSAKWLVGGFLALAALGGIGWRVYGRTHLSNGTKEGLLSQQADSKLC
jgi:uncharacterized protein (DUF2237 family)